MATLMIRDLDDGVKARLRVRAAQNGRSMEAEARAILRAALTGPATQRGLGTRINQRFADIEIPIPIAPRVEPPRSADFSS